MSQEQSEPAAAPTREPIVAPAELPREARFRSTSIDGSPLARAPWCAYDAGPLLNTGAEQRASIAKIIGLMVPKEASGEAA